MSLLQLVIGNSNSDDGNRTIPVLLETYGQSKAYFSDAFSRGSEKLGFNLIADEDFDNSRRVTTEHIKALFRNGMSSKLFEELFGEEFVEFDDDGEPIGDDDYDYFVSDINCYVKLWLWIAVLGTPSLLFDILEPDFIRIGGDVFIEYD